MYLDLAHQILADDDLEATNSSYVFVSKRKNRVVKFAHYVEQRDTEVHALELLQEVILVPAVINQGLSEHVPYFLREYIQGNTLLNCTPKQGRELKSMLKFVHAAGVANLDICRSNVLDSNNGLAFFDFHKAIFRKDANFEYCKAADQHSLYCLIHNH